MSNNNNNNNMKSWADEQDDSSDEDDEVIPIIPPSGFPSIGNANFNNTTNNVAVVETAAIEEDTTSYQIPPKEFILPTQAPYTAFLGNLPYDIRNSNDLGREMEALLQERQCAALVNGFTNARLMMEKGSNTSRGYGYVDFETDGELLEFLHLPNPKLCGRNIKVDVAIGTPRTSSARSAGGGRGERGGRDSSSSRRGSDSRDGRGRGSISSGSRQHSDRSDSGVRVDGSQFMGGRYAGGCSNSGNNLNSSAIGGGGGGGKTTPTAVMRRADSSASQGTRDAEDAAPADAVTKQRPSLKLLARSKPLDTASSSTATTQSSIFGGAKPRDESKFVPAAAEASVETKNVSSNDATKDLTSGVAKMEISKKDVTVPVSDDLAVGNSKSGENNGSESTETPAAPTPKNNDKEPPKTNYERKDSRGGGGGGRGGSGRGRGGNRNRENGDGKREGRRDSTVKSGRGERGAGGKGRGGSEGRGEGRSTNNERRNSKSTKNGSSTASGKNNAESVKGKSGGVSSLAAAAAAAVAGEATPKTLPTMPTASEANKGPPKKVNSFAAFMDDSDSD